MIEIRRKEKRKKNSEPKIRPRLNTQKAFHYLLHPMVILDADHA